MICKMPTRCARRRHIVSRSDDLSTAIKGAAPRPEGTTTAPSNTGLLPSDERTPFEVVLEAADIEPCIWGRTPARACPVRDRPQPRLHRRGSRGCRACLNTWDSRPAPRCANAVTVFNGSCTNGRIELPTRRRQGRRQGTPQASRRARREKPSDWKPLTKA